MEGMIKPRRARTLALASAAAGMLVAVSACGSSNTPSATGASGSDAAAKTISITIGDTAIGAGYSDLYVGIDDGIFKKHGLDVTLQKLNTGTALVPALVGGSIQIGVGPADGSAGAIMHGVGLKFFALSEGLYNLEVWGDPSIKSIQDLAGKKIAVTTAGGESDAGAIALLAKNGLTGKVEIVHTGSIPGEFSALYSGSVNAVVNQPPQVNAAGAKGYHKITTLADLPYAVGTYTVTSKYAAEHPETLQRFASAEVEILKYLRTHPAETLTAIQKNSGVTDPKLAKYAYDFFLNVWTTEPTVQPVSVIQDAFDRAAKQAKKTAPTDVTKYIDNSFVQKALSSAG